MPAGHGVSRPRRRLDRRRAPGARARRHGALHRRQSRPGRARGGNPARLRHRGRAGGAGRGGARGGGVRRGRRGLARLPPDRCGAPGLRRARRLRRRAPRRRGPSWRRQGVSLRPARPQGRRSRGARGPRHRRVRRPQTARCQRQPGAAGIPGAPLSRRRQAVRARRTPRSDSEIHRRVAAGARSARRHDLGEGQVARQEGDARHGGGAAQALRAAQGRRRVRLRSRHALAGGVRERLSRTS